MRLTRFFIFIIVSSVLSVQSPNFALAESRTDNAIISEGNGAAVFIGYGGDRQVELSWRPSKEFDASVILYQIQRSDGAMLESRTRASSFVDKNLQPNTFYGYQLTVFQTVVRDVTVKGKKTQKTSVKKIGSNDIRVLTLPSMVVNLRGAGIPTADNRCSGDFELTWELPQHSTNDLTYSVLLNGNIMVYGIPKRTLSHTLRGLKGSAPGSATSPCTTYYNLEVVVENDTGPAKVNAKLNGVRF